MKPIGDETTSRRLLAGRLVWVLMVLALGILVVVANADRADGQAPSIVPSERVKQGEDPTARQVTTATLPAWVLEAQEGDQAPAAGNELTVLKEVTTGWGDDSTVYNGEYITYKITISNPTEAKASDIVLLDVLPRDALESKSIVCTGDCGKINDTEYVPGPLGGTIEVTVTRQISWEISSLAAGKNVVRTFWGRIVGQADGTEVKNRAFINYKLSGEVKSGTSNETATTVRVRIENPGQPNLSSAPTWFSADMGGTVGMDWGDWNGDGYLDLALGSTVGTSIYRSQGGRLQLFGDKDPQTYGVGWGDLDLDPDDKLELIAVGDSVDGTATTPGSNSLYSYYQADNEFKGSLLATNLQEVRVAPGKYNGDEYVDLVISTNSINATCPISLYINTKDPDEPFVQPGECIASEATAAISPADYDNDGDLDLALGQFPNLTYILINSGTATSTNPFTDGILYKVEGLAQYLAYDFAWGDYDQDGFLDLAVAFPLERKVRIANNPRGDSFPLEFDLEIPTGYFRTPLAIDWGDFNGDGRLDLAVADSPPKIYEYDAKRNRFTQILSLPPGAVSGEVWGLRAVDQENDGDLDLALTNRDGPSMIFTNFAPLLRTQLSAIDFTGSPAVSSVAWGDADADGDLDLLFGAGTGAVAAKLFYSQVDRDAGRVVFPKGMALSFLSSGFGPQDVAFGDVNGDRLLDIALAVGTSAGTQLYLAGNTESPDWTSDAPHSPGYSVAWGDADDDHDLDLLVGREGANALYLNEDGVLLTSPIWLSPQTDRTQSVAWGDYDGDRYLDMAVGNDGRNRIYHNNRDRTFSLIWSSSFLSNTTSVAWADFDRDGDQDLAVGNRDGANLIYRNEGGSFAKTPVWRSPQVFKTTSLAWGDWNNDGTLDLAVGNDNQADQVYVNLTKKAGTPQLYWIWTSDEIQRTSDVAWGDQDGDGDLDLAIGQQGNGSNGVYENTYIMPSHLWNQFARTMPLPNNPSYVSVEPPGQTPAAFFYSSAELLSGPKNPTVTIQYKLFDPDGTRDDSTFSDARGDDIQDTQFEFSLDGGATWKTATPLITAAPQTKTKRLGEPAQFLWDAVTDEAISDDARFRVRIVPRSPVGPVQRSAISAISSPFRVRATSCVWPSKPSITVNNDEPKRGEELRFEGSVLEASDILTYSWQFGDGDTAVGQLVYHTYESHGPYVVTMTVHSEPCPIVKEVVAFRPLVVAPNPTDAYLPIVFKAPPIIPTEAVTSTLLSPDGVPGEPRGPSPPADTDAHHIQTQGRR